MTERVKAILKEAKARHIITLLVENHAASLRASPR